jgi:CRP/FNR family transcriptional regulator, cyclic AMP receptor protein
MITQVLEKPFYSTGKIFNESFQCPIRSDCSLSFLCTPIERGVHGFVSDRRLIDKGTIFSCGKDDDPFLYVIRSGLAVMFSLSTKGEETFYGILSKGQSFGNTDLFVNYKYVNKTRVIRYALARALTDLDTCKINLKLLDQLMKANPELYGVIINTIYNNVSSMAQYVEILSTRPVYERIKKMLLLFVELEGPEGREVTLSLTHDDLAHMVGVDRVTVTRMLRQLEIEGLVRLGNRKLTVASQPKEETDNIVYLERAGG